MNKNNVVVLGKFDGVHIAHMCLVEKAVEIAAKFNKKTLVYSMQKTGTVNLTDQKQKEEILKKQGIDLVVFRTLDREFMDMSAKDFAEKILFRELDAAYVVVGENFRFGKNRMADCYDLKHLLADFGIDVIVIDTVKIGGCDVSSTKIRSLVSNGEMQEAKAYLGRAYSVNGIVSEGKHLGTKLGFPTVNLYPDIDTHLPKRGVYATVTHHSGKSYFSVTNVGINPTVEDTRSIKLETHILEDVGNLYGEEITVEFVDFIREERVFDSIWDLKIQIEKDKQRAIEINKSFAD